MATLTRIPDWLGQPLYAQLAAAGFQWSGRTARRRTNRKWDMLTIELIRKTVCQKWNVPFGSFALEAGCFLPFVPPKDTQECPCCRTERRPRSYLDGQVRLWVERGIFQPEVKTATNLWFVDLHGPKNAAVLTDTMNTVARRVLPFFSETDDLEGFLALLRSDIRDSIGSTGIWHIGNPGSYMRLFYTGFVALELGNWHVAHHALIACHDVAVSLKLTSVSPSTLACLRNAAALALRQERLPACATTT